MDLGPQLVAAIPIVISFFFFLVPSAFITMNFIKKAQAKMASGVAAVASGAHAVAEKSAAAVNARFGPKDGDSEFAECRHELESLRDQVASLRDDFNKYAQCMTDLGYALESQSQFPLFRSLVL